MNPAELDYMIPVNRFWDIENGDSEDRPTFIEAEAAEDVLLHISPLTDEIVTVQMSAEAAWRLIRQLAEAAAEVQGGE